MPSPVGVLLIQLGTPDAPTVPALRRYLRQFLSDARQMVWIALGLLVFATALVAINTAGGRWGMDYWRMPRRFDPATQQWADRPTYQQWVDRTEALAAVMTVASNPAAAGAQSAVFAANRAVLQESGFFVFSSWVIFSIYLSFLLPIWSLSFATEALGAEREGSSLVWLLTRPLSRGVRRSCRIRDDAVGGPAPSRTAQCAAPARAGAAAGSTTPMR